MKSSDKKQSDLSATLANLRSRNQRLPSSPLPIADEALITGSGRQRFSPNKPRVNTLDRKPVMHAIIRDLLLGNITQGQALKRLRIEVLGLRQDDYARLVKVARKTLSEVENDKGNFSAEMINKVFKPFGLETGLVPTSKSLIVSLLANEPQQP
ncbi:helix-turn-helix domain-containing protein [Leclercia sp. 29361]|jgi:DNA-binding XRE family transcriptional regulator|uniref:helix-turn-helix domain-containing protein n=1 Tax=Leclercia TaxID=83654 RepID=UPI00140B4B56|nr:MULTISPECIES: helix-turn-helix domain-containing protein [Leclercia]MCU6683050.1 helix-turn-helix domain-containing protein [Leclercia tamurae]MDY0922280.1 helix-turn-helix domain-containing protein [Leclercia sp. CFBP8987]QIK14694.1 helix-turn-helix domain-containing protein [Leclercia sp. 29361]